MRTSGRTNSTPGLDSPIYIGQAQGEGGKTYKKRSQNWAGGFSSHLLGWPAFIPRGCILRCFLNKTELQHRAVTSVCLRKLHGALTLAQRLKCLPAMQETWVQSLGREDPLEKEMATHSSILAWRIPWTEEPGGLQSMGSQRVRHD